MANNSTYSSANTVLNFYGTPRNQTAVGLDATLILISQGVPASAGTADAGTGEVNTLYNIGDVPDAARIFGTGSRMHTAVDDALAQQPVPQNVKALMPEPIESQVETPASNGDALLNNPIVEDLDGISANTGGTSPSSLTVDFRYESPPPSPGSADDVSQTADVYINPNTGETAGFATGNEVTYRYLDWQSALTAPDLDRAVRETEMGTVAVDAESVDVGTTLSQSINTLSGNLRLLTGMIAAQPNDTVLEDVYDPATDSIVQQAAGRIDIGTYSDTYDNHRLFVPGPVRISGFAGVRRSCQMAIGAKMAGNRLTNALYGDRLTGFGALSQQLGPSVGGPNTGIDQDFEDLGLMPIIDLRQPGHDSLKVGSTPSTSSLTDIPRDLHRRRVFDSFIGDLWPIATSLEGERIRQDVLTNRRTRIEELFQNYIDAGLIRESISTPAAGGFQENQQVTDATAGAGQEERQAYFAVLKQTGADEISVAIGLSVVGIAKDIFVDLYGGPAENIAEEASTQALGDTEVQAMASDGTVLA